MDDVNKLCMGCMRPRNSTEERCPHCGYLESEHPPLPEMLKPWTIVNGKYILGRSLGDGGFGITYIGWEINLEKRVAIKEFRPYGFVYRNSEVSNKLIPNDARSEEFFLSEREKFIDEAKTLSRLEEQPGIVKVLDYFEENNTAYIVMEFLEGETLKTLMKKAGGKLPAAEVLSLMQPVIRSMAGIHHKGLIHRDISPDNIMLTARKQVKLIDFGAVFRAKNRADLTTMLYKEGYSPLEQETENMELGTYTDIYAFCATMYHAMTGVLPQDAALRKIDDKLLPPTELGAGLTPLQEAAIMNGLALQAEDRIKDAEDLYYFLYLYGQDETTKEEATPQKMQVLVQEKRTRDMVTELKKKGETERKRRTILFAGILIAVVLICISTLMTAYRLGNRGESSAVKSGAAEADGKEEEYLPTGFLAEEELTDRAESYKALLCEEAVSQGGAFEADAQLSEAAEELATACAEKKLESAEEKGELCNSLAESTMEKYNCTEAGWEVICTSAEAEAEKAFEQLDTSLLKGNIQNSNRIGAAVSQATDGWLYWVYFAN